MPLVMMWDILDFNAYVFCFYILYKYRYRYRYRNVHCTSTSFHPNCLSHLSFSPSKFPCMLPNIYRQTIHQVFEIGIVYFLQFYSKKHYFPTNLIQIYELPSFTNHYKYQTLHPNFSTNNIYTFLTLYIYRYILHSWLERSKLGVSLS